MRHAAAAALHFSRCIEKTIWNCFPQCSNSGLLLWRIIHSLFVGLYFHIYFFSSVSDTYLFKNHNCNYVLALYTFIYRNRYFSIWNANAIPHGGTL